MKPIALWPAWARNLPRLLLLGLLGWWLVNSATANEIAAGLALFLLGMRSLEDGVRALAGSGLETLVRTSTRSTLGGLVFGFFATVATQSSGIVSLMTMSFVSAKMISLNSGLALILGANIGTTTGTWIFATLGASLDLARYALPFVSLGMVLRFSRERAFAATGHILIGLGLILFGIHYLKIGSELFQQQFDLRAYAPPGYAGLLTYTAVGTLATVVMQSSHATMLLTVAALASGQIGFDNALAIAIGANIGSTATALLGAIGADVAAKRLALGHFFFNLFAAVLALAAFPLFRTGTRLGARLLGLPEDDALLQLAFFHTFFNAVGVCLALPNLSRFLRLLQRLLPDTTPALTAPKYLSPTQLKTPDVAIESLRKETWRLFDRAIDLIALVIQVDPKAMRAGEDPHELDHPPARVHTIDIDGLYRARIKPLSGLIVDFAARLAPPAPLAAKLQHILQASAAIQEAVKDTKHLQKNLVPGLQHPNSIVQRQYLRYRRHLVETLYAIAHLPREPGCDGSAAELTLVTHTSLAQLDPLANGLLEEWLKNGELSPEEATSMMNDTAYVRRITENLLTAARLLGEAALPPHAA